MPDISEAQAGDVFVDAEDKLWRVTEVVQEPSVTMAEIEPAVGNGERATRAGVVSHEMWGGFSLAHRPRSTLGRA